MSVVVVLMFVGLNVPVASGKASGNEVAAASSRVSVTPLTGPVPPTSDMIVAFFPAGPTSNTSMSLANPWVIPLSLTVTLVTVPANPAIDTLEGYGKAGPLVPVAGIAMLAVLVTVTHGTGVGVGVGVAKPTVVSPVENSPKARATRLVAIDNRSGASFTGEPTTKGSAGAPACGRAVSFAATVGRGAIKKTCDKNAAINIIVATFLTRRPLTFAIRLKEYCKRLDAA